MNFYKASGKWTNEHQMSVNNRRDGFSSSGLLTVARNMGIRPAREMIDQVKGDRVF